MSTEPSGKKLSLEQRIEQAKNRDILEVAEALGMEMKRNSTHEYYWTEHDSLKVNTRKNTFRWYSRTDVFGDPVDLVQAVKEVSFKEAIHFLETGEFKEATIDTRPREEFSYYLGRYEEPFIAADNYLQTVRGLSADTINFFGQQGVLAQAKKKAKDGSLESVVVFKSLDKKGNVIGASLQGIEPRPELYERKGYLKQILAHSDGLSGLSVDIGTPKRLVFAEAPIDLMSYYEANKDRLSDVRLVSMDGLKIGTISRYTMELLAELQGKTDYQSDLNKVGEALEALVSTTTFFKDGKNADLIALAVDNDEAGREFIADLEEKGIPIQSDLPPLSPGQEKTDWNDYLKEQKGVVEDYEKKVDELISEITKDDTNYYLWHDEELNNMDAGDTVVEEFHSSLEDTRYQIAGVTLYVAESINDGATGYLSIEGHALDDNGIRDYLSDKGLSGAAAVEFLRKLQAELPDIWDKVIDYYDKQLNTIIEKYGLTEEITSNQKEKPLDNYQETLDSDAGEFHRTSDFSGDVSPRTASQPVVDEPQPDFPVIAHLQFTTRGAYVSNKKQDYHIVDGKELRRLNRFAPTLQTTAQWYLKELADSKVFYVYATASGAQEIIQINFQKKNFAHLAGISPVNITMAEALEDFAYGRGDYENILLSNAIKDKMKVIPLLPEILEAESFVFNDLSDVEKLHNIDMSKAINPEDTDLLVLFKNTDKEGLIPASLMRIKGSLGENLNKIDKEVVLGVYRERNGVLEQLSINEEYVKDGGQEMLSILKNNQYQEVSEENLTQSEIVSPALFTQVLDAAYNVGNPKDLGIEFPEESKAAWVIYDELSRIHSGNFTSIVDAADQIGLVDKESNFYQEWSQDRVYNKTYHVRVQWFEKWPDGPQLPFNEADLIEYETFAKELYKQNSIYYAAHQESKLEADLVTNEGYFPYTKVKFSVYAPEGELLQEVRYDVADETKPISQLLALGPRRLKEAADLAAIDKRIWLEVGSVKGLDFEKQLDSDGDGYSDYEERSLGSDRYNANSTPGQLQESVPQPAETMIPQHQVEGEKKMDENQTRLFDNLADVTPSQPVPEEVTDTRTIAEIIQVRDTKALSKRMKEGIKEYFNSDTYKNFLTTMSKFPDYSPGNIGLILAQNPKATHVASFNKWRDDFGRNVNKGSKALWIWAPMMVDKIDKKTKEVVLDDNGKPVKVMRFKLVHVFDVSQTSGKELPKPVYELTGTYEEYGRLFNAAREVSKVNGVPISFVADANGARGYYDTVNKEIAILEGMSEQQTLKTIFHEMAHSDLHSLGDGYTSSERELQAESIAFVVASHYGLDTSEYSFAYLASWSRDKVGLSDLEAQLDIVQKEASSLINRIDATLEKYQAKDVTKDSFQEKLSQYNEVSTPTAEKTEEKSDPKKEELGNEEMNL
ncbi:PBECR4 domain-containing protein [Streptococcus ovis]|uniref:PBECR4 domain-containing protein n=1 Tax=Streptococcus ovis TaxID=82806 RepID=UPI00035F52DD|nr:PBECR4 domain-containing protein [Streptococcus ovis]